MNQPKHSVSQNTAQDEAAQASGSGTAKGRDPLTMVAWGLSFLMHPLPLPSILFGLVLLFAPEMMLPGNYEIRWKLAALLFLATFALPALSVLTLRLFGNIPSLTMTRREDRRLPFLFVSGIYLIITYFFYKIFPQIPFVALALMSITASLLVLTLISLYWKISAHSIAAGGATGFITGLMLYLKNPELIYPLAILLFLSGAVMWARLHLNHHRPPEVWIGWFTGFSVCLTMVLLLHPIL